MDFSAGISKPALAPGETPIQRLFARFVALHEHSPRGLWYLGVMGLVISPLYYLLRFTKSDPGYDDWWLRALHIFVGAAMFFRSKWPEQWKPYFYPFAYFALIFTCPFTFVFKALQDGGGPVSVGNTLLATFFVLMLSDWRNMIVIMLTGVAAATGLYVATEPAPTMPVDYVQRLPILLALMLGGTLFKRAFETATIERTRALERQVSESRVSALQECIGFLGHELNTPLATVRLSVNAISSKHLPGKDGESSHQRKAIFREDAPGEIMALLEGAEAQALYCQSLVEQVMKSAFHLRPSGPAVEFSAAELVKALTDSYPFSHVERRWLEVAVHRDFLVTGSRELYFLVLSTLTKNALHSLSGRERPRLFFEVIGDPHQDGVGKIRLSDSGVGIAKSQLEELTKIVERSHGVFGDGAGMGLMFCARVMEACNGSLSIESTLQQGTTVTLQFSPSWIQV